MSLQAVYWLFFFFAVLMIVSSSWPEHSPKTAGNLLSFIFFSHVGLLYVFSSFTGFYGFYFVVFPAFLNKKKRRMLLYAFLFSVLLSLILWTGWIGIRMPRLGPFGGSIIRFAGAVLLVALLIFGNGVMALMIRGFVKWLHELKLNEALNEKRYQTEIELLKSKINPHFLFNTINNIDMLISRDPEKASKYLNELSDIMRFMLYETKGDRIPLSKELDYIQKYIDLQRIRSSNTSYVIYRVSGDNMHLPIAPMLFIPFIENAFKHAESKKSEQAIAIYIDSTHNKITFECSNRYSASPAGGLYAGGLGNELMKKRLQLLYPGKHLLEITDKDDLYTVKLTITPHAY